MSLGELLIGFLQYYTYFNYNMFAISVRTGSRLPTDECRYARSLKNDPHQWKFLCIEEPFDLSNTARSVYDPIQFRRIRNVFNKSYKTLVRERSLASILCNVEKNNQRWLQSNNVRLVVFYLCQHFYVTLVSIHSNFIFFRCSNIQKHCSFELIFNINLLLFTTFK